jgi:hypothetical protein
MDAFEHFQRFHGRQNAQTAQEAPLFLCSLRSLWLIHSVAAQAALCISRLPGAGSTALGLVRVRLTQRSHGFN